MRGEGEQLVGEPPHLGLGGQVGDEGVHSSAACQTYFFGGFFRALRVPADDDDVGPHLSQAVGGCLADASGCAGDDHGPARHGLHVLV